MRTPAKSSRQIGESVPWNGVERVAFRRHLLSWYRRNARDLPWRQVHDAYAIWVSEVMLQQTQVQTVIPYFEQFLQVFPEVGHLAAASQRQVLRHWEGLGYYRRAIQLHQAARDIVARHAGRIPADLETFRSLPGVGRYTAGAVLSLGFDQRLPILEANTQRLWCRLLGLARDPRQAASQRQLWGAAQAILPARGSGRLNQALMELGSLVCRPVPNCPACPVTYFCHSFRQGRQHQIPIKGTPVRPESLRQAAVVIRHRQMVLMWQYRPGERWAGLWDYPRFTLPHTGHDEPATRRAVRTEVRNQFGLRLRRMRQLVQLRHAVTRFRIDLACYQAEPVTNGTACPPFHRVDRTMRWVPLARVDSLPQCVTGRKISRLVARDCD